MKRGFKDVMGKGIQRKNQEDLLKLGLQYEISVLSEPDIQGDPRLLEIEFKKISSRIGRSGSSVLNDDKRKRFRQQVCDNAIVCTEQLLTNNLIARSLACELLLHMEVVAPKGGVRLQMHDKVSKILINVLKDPNQPDAIKLRSANCIKKYLQKGAVFDQVQMAFAAALADELRRPFTEVAYQDTIIKTLESISSSRQPVSPGRPLHFQAAVELMQDRTRDMIVRCRCARLLGRAGYDSKIKFDPLAWKVAELTVEAGFKFSKRNGEQERLKAQRCGWYLYTAFHHEDRKDLATRKGMLNRDNKSQLVQSSYQKSVPTMAHLMFSDQNIALGNLTKLNAWLNANIPRSGQWDAACAPIKFPAPAAN